MPSSTIAVVGAGANLGRAIARRFGAAGHPVALIARGRDRLNALAAALAEEGVTARAYPADATDPRALTAALDAAAADLGRVGVLSYSPAPVWDHSGDGMPDTAAMGFTSTLETTPASARAQFDLVVGGGLTAAAAVLPAMRRARDGALLYTTGASAIAPLPILGNAGIAQAGLRNWLGGAHTELAAEGVYVGHLSIGVPIVPGAGDGDPDAIADRWYRLARTRDTFETTIGI
ncbi:SDR family NAD(P)-dependent oxidoreductase [Streptomyces hainanensis]|uniref:SDR family NAD(P)-dependent oxidoreductase n=1 Tax=Streptomyces hainanensis TaxID=402648 RepID=A0A4R4T0B5_9ACTN|nr:SDR family NAD(P)-dependent oxidoreductase [Streptomyces hainanensis]TDC67783.1 SDR family NAD(P)-dependent oxidoreductase [Streptomyces hainanensis]